MNAAQTNNFQALLLGKDSRLAELLLPAVRQDGGALVQVSRHAEAHDLIRKHALDILFLDLHSAEDDCLDLLRQLKQHPLPQPVLSIGFGPATETTSTLRAFDLGLNQFIQTPFESGLIRARLSGAVLLQRTLDELTRRQQELAEA